MKMEIYKILLKIYPIIYYPMPTIYFPYDFFLIKNEYSY